MKVSRNKTLLLFIILCTVICKAQNNNPELTNIIELGLNNNKELKSYQLQSESSKANIETAFTFDKTNVYYNYDQNNIAPNDKPLRVFGIEQSFLFPTVYGAQRNVYKAQWQQEKAMYEIRRNKFILDISMVYEDIVYIQNKEKLYTELDSLYDAFSKAGNRKFELGESNYLEKITSEAKAKQIRTTLNQLKKQKEAFYDQLRALVQSDTESIISNCQLKVLSFDNTPIGKNLQNKYYESTSNIYASQIKLIDQGWFPDLNIQLFTGTNKGLGFHQNGFQIGVAIPILFTGNTSKKRVAKLEKMSWETMKENQQLKMESFHSQKQAELSQHLEMIDYYTNNGKNLSNEILKTAVMSYQNGEIDFFQYIQSIENALSIEADYLDNVLAYNKTYLELYYFNFND